MKKLKIALIGAGSISFALCTLQDLVLSDKIKRGAQLEVALMDISKDNLQRTYDYAKQMFTAFDNPALITSTTDLDTAVTDADFVVVAIEVERLYYWSQDFHIPRRYGSKQVYGENGGPGSMFHALRNMGPMLEIARAMERLCPDAWLINYTNPEAKLVEAISKLTKVKVVGLCHGLDMGIEQVASLMQMDAEDVAVEGGGLNHFGFFTKIWHAKTGEDLYPLLQQKEQEANRLAQYDHYYLMRVMYRLYGLYPYPGTNHCGEYLSYGGDFYAGIPLNYAYDPLNESPWTEGARIPEPIYGAEAGTVGQELFEAADSHDSWHEQAFTFNKDDVEQSAEYGVPIIEAIFFDEELAIRSVNMPNNGAIKGLPDDMVVETQAIACGRGLRLVPMTIELPTAVIGTINVQAAIHKLVIEAYNEGSKKKLLQAVLLDPTAPSYYQAAAMIDEMCERQKGILPELRW